MLRTKAFQLVDVTQQPYSLVPATIVPDFSSDRLEDVERIWSPFRDRLREELAKQGITIEHGHWNWKNKQESIIGRRCQFIAVESMNSVQGLAAVLMAGQLSQIDRTRELLYDRVPRKCTLEYFAASR